jgi:hypothetical protein
VIFIFNIFLSNLYIYIYKTNKCTSIFVMCFIHRVLTNINTSPTRSIKTQHITASVITPHRPNNFKTQGFCNDLFNPYLYYLHNFNRNYICNCNGVMVTQLTKFVRLYSCNNITLKLARMPAETRC